MPVLLSPSTSTTLHTVQVLYSSSVCLAGASIARHVGCAAPRRTTRSSSSATTAIGSWRCLIIHTRTYIRTVRVELIALQWRRAAARTTRKYTLYANCSCLQLDALCAAGTTCIACVHRLWSRPKATGAARCACASSTAPRAAPTCSTPPPPPPPLPPPPLLPHPPLHPPLRYSPLDSYSLPLLLYTLSIFAFPLYRFLQCL